MGKFYLTKKEAEDINKAETFYELVNIAYKALDRMNNPIIQVCGPISTGGSSSVKENIKNLSRAIDVLTKKDFNVFNQLFFEDAFDRIMNKYEVKSYDKPILNEFYGPIFKSGKIKELYFIPGWQDSVGAKWEYNYAKKVGIKRIILKNKWEDGFSSE